jgi:hypothetical protein
MHANQLKLCGEDTMPKVDLTYQQVLDAVKQLTSQEREQLETALRESRPSEEYPVFMADDPLWNLVGVGKGTGEPVARQHDDYLYRKD